MAYSPKVMETAKKRFNDRKEENKRAYDDRHVEICKKIPEYGKLELELAGTMTESIQAMAEKKEDSKEIVRRAMVHNQEIQANMERLLEEHGYPRNYMSPIFSCPKCRDSGTTEYGWCECFTNLVKAAAAEEFNKSSLLELCGFDDFKLSYYSDSDATKMGKSSRDIMGSNLKVCRDFAENFTGKGKGLLITGKTGLGKTHLSLSIAKELIERGFSVMYNSAPSILSMLEKESYGKSDTDLMPLLTTCDLLILDDLGTEYKSDRYPTFLYEMINTRQARMLPIIINTNLDVNGITERYQGKLCSRILSLDILIFSGSDNRFQK